MILLAEFTQAKIINCSSRLNFHTKSVKFHFLVETSRFNKHKIEESSLRKTSKSNYKFYNFYSIHLIWNIFYAGEQNFPIWDLILFLLSWYGYFFNILHSLQRKERFLNYPVSSSFKCKIRGRILCERRICIPAD